MLSVYPPPSGAFNGYLWNRCQESLTAAVLRFLSKDTALEESQINLTSLRLDRTVRLHVDFRRVYFTAVLGCEYDLHGNPEAISRGGFFWISGEVNLHVDSGDVKIVQVSPVNPQVTLVNAPLLPLPGFPGIPVNQNLLPVLSGISDDAHKERMEQEAGCLLSEFCPECLETPMAVPIRSIAEERLGLNIVADARLSTDLSIRGRMLFANTVVTLYDEEDAPSSISFPAGTMLIDSYVFWHRGIGSMNFTIAHELYHWYRHWAYAVLRDATEQVCPVGKGAQGNYTSADIAEIQANALAARILIPKPTVIRKFTELSEGYDLSEAENVYTLVSQLAEFYQVSRQAMTIRLKDLGLLDEASPPTPQETTYVSLADAFDIYANDDGFREKVESNQYRYVDHHFIINLPEYIDDSGKKPVMTPYAREHEGECCVHFLLNRIRVPEDAQPSSLLSYDYSFLQEKPGWLRKNNPELYRRFEQMKAGYARQLETCAKQHPSFCSLAWQFMEAKKWRKEDFIAATSQNGTLYHKIRRGTIRSPETRTIVSLCVGLQLDANESTNLIHAGGRHLMWDKEDMAYRFIIHNLTTEDIVVANTLLTMLNLPPLGAGSMTNTKNKQLIPDQA